MRGARWTCRVHSESHSIHGAVVKGLGGMQQLWDRRSVSQSVTGMYKAGEVYEMHMQGGNTAASTLIVTARDLSRTHNT
jgi:hypothetical protein